ncbi:MAG: PASTA domain-containing protein [Bacteroidales bacterium]|nr:PASTA domain-containing protein [Bacteroidales bacterium]
MGKLSFLKQKKFYIHLLIIIVLAVIILWLTIRMLGVYTRHGEENPMPNLTGLTIEEAEEAYGRNYHFILIDSVYSKTEKPGTIVQQDPIPDSKVKRGRNVYYITVAKTREKTTLPDVKNRSLRYTVVMLENSGLQVEEICFINGAFRNAVQKLSFNGQEIEKGAELYKGDAVKIYVSYGDDRRDVKLPSLYGTPVESVKHTLNMAGLNLGKEVYENHDSLQYMKVSRMDPPYSKGKVKPGTFVNVWYKSSREFNFEKEKNHAMQEDSTQFAIEQALLIDTVAIDTTAIIANDTIDIERYEDDF